MIAHLRKTPRKESFEIPPVHEEQILAEQVHQLYKVAPIGFLGTLFNSVIVFLIMRKVTPDGVMAIWLTAVLSVTGLRALLVVSFRRAQPHIDGALWEKRFVTTAGLVGLAWGSISYIPFTFSLPHQVFIAYVLGGMAAGASSTFAKVRYGFPAFAIPTILPFAIHFFFIGDAFHYGMAAMAFIYLLLLWYIAHNNYQVNRESLLLRFENQDMIKVLKEANEEVALLNEQLSEEIKGKQEAERELREHHRQLARTVEERTADLVRANEQLKVEIEERKEVEKALVESNERLVLAQRAGRIGVFDWDMVTGQVILTAELEELYGLQPGEFTRDYRSWSHLVDPADLAALEESIPLWIEKQAGQLCFQYRLIGPDGSMRWMAATVTIAYDAEGTALRMIGTNMDFSEMKEAQANLQAAKEAAEAGSRAKSQFLANMSHEMRTPLAGVLGMLKLVLDMEINSEQKELLGMARRSAESLLRLIEDVLDFSRLEAGVMKFEKKPFDISEVVRSAIEVVSLSARDRGIDLSWEVEKGLPHELEGDAGRVRQVLVNLLGNAVKFTEEGGVEVTVRPGDEESVLFAVRDTGVGIAPADIEGIFGNFTQIDSSLTRRYGGTGLGLALSRQIVESIGGRIWVESSAGVGSTFYFTIPLQP
ncbi:ATP-binding protein [Geomonas sp. RF6]|uniref:ATP-binding protein n=1 Tax=Geomonas sp. RF6 TaxID=2897342 RepID=UPI001E372D01|nr:ATP-binding protein [Geomonas sp. RF6]UFS72513.1 ATP-binding protein [Geomonas sp. RF6]